MLLKDKIAMVTCSTHNIGVGSALRADGRRLNAMSSGSSR
jgi:hypothetical protein